MERREARALKAPWPLLLRKGLENPADRPAPSAAGQSKCSGKRPEATRLLTRAPILAVILEKPIRIPRFLSVKASHVLKGFLNKVHL